MVAGRLVNCYATNDWILALLYRYSKVQLLQNYTCGVTTHVYLCLWVVGRTKSYEIGVAGLHPVSINTSNVSPRVFPNECAEKASTSNAPAGRSARDFALPLLTAAAGVSEVENLDVSHLISSHADYPLALASILDMVKL